MDGSSIETCRVCFVEQDGPTIVKYCWGLACYGYPSNISSLKLFLVMTYILDTHRFLILHTYRFSHSRGLESL